MMKSKLTQLLFMTAFVELVAPSCRRRRRGAKAHGRNPALICSLNGWPTAVHLEGPPTTAVVGGKLRVCRLMAVRPEGADHQWRRIPPRELSIDLVADERFGRVTGRAGAS